MKLRKTMLERKQKLSLHACTLILEKYVIKMNFMNGLKNNLIGYSKLCMTMILMQKLRLELLISISQTKVLRLVRKLLTKI